MNNPRYTSCLVSPTCSTFPHRRTDTSGGFRAAVARPDRLERARRHVMFGTGILRNSRRTGLMDYATRARQWLKPTPNEIAIFHITHQKAGSQWIHRIFHALCYDRMILPEVESAATHERPIEGIQFLHQP